MIPQLVLNFEENSMFNGDVLRESAPGNCFMVFIGGKNQRKVDNIIRKMEMLRKKVLYNKMIFYITEKTDETPKLDSTTSFLVIIYINFKSLGFLFL